MKVLYKNTVYQVLADNWNGLFLADSASKTGVTFVPFSTYELVIDPTDDEVEGANDDTDRGD